MTTSEFWLATSFDYIITYSLNRGPKLDAIQEAAKLLVKEIRSQLLVVPSSQLPLLRKQLRLLERTHGIDMLSLTQGPTAYNITASPVSVISRDSPEQLELAGILQAPVLNRMYWMCGPVYRDALAFYDAQDNLTAVLNICFDCDQMLTHTGEEVEADTATYKQLLHFLIQKGHSISNPDGMPGNE
ncbi:hypothetical protein GCM10023185_29360 [Hymenobacter saemangeumensis]|uniref:Uncharacterized protein n=1 Tax=Hymenobacter saemangeumensis TaxID=1084522 RepID=A0ABP8IKZ6_9BACT